MRTQAEVQETLAALVDTEKSSAASTLWGFADGMRKDGRAGAADLQERGLLEFVSALYEILAAATIHEAIQNPNNRLAGIAEIARLALGIEDAE